MRRKLTITICACAVLLGTAGLALAVPIPVASFPFKSAADLSSFTQVEGAKCTTKYLPTKAMGVNAGAGSSECAFRTSVVADSSDTAPSQDVQASVSLDQKMAVSLRRKVFLAVFVRGGTDNASAGDYELRVIPATQHFTVIRRGTGGGALARGTASIKPGKPNILRLRITGNSLIASINGKAVFAGPDPSPAPPSGRFNGIALGNKSRGSASGMRGSFTNVIVRIPF
jgi:hypothetical protein